MSDHETEVQRLADVFKDLRDGGVTGSTTGKTWTYSPPRVLTMRNRLGDLVRRLADHIDPTVNWWRQ